MQRAALRRDQRNWQLKEKGFEAHTCVRITSRILRSEVSILGTGSGMNIIHTTFLQHTWGYGLWHIGIMSLKSAIYCHIYLKRMGTLFVDPGDFCHVCTIWFSRPTKTAATFHDITHPQISKGNSQWNDKMSPFMFAPSL